MTNKKRMPEPVEPEVQDYDIIQEETEKEIPNEVPEEVVEEKDEVRRKPSSKGKKVFFGVLRGDYLRKFDVKEHLPFALWVLLLLILWIGNTYLAEDMNKEIVVKSHELKKLRVESVYLDSEVTKATTQSEMSRRVKGLKIVESVEPLKKIVVEKGGAR